MMYKVPSSLYIGRIWLVLTLIGNTLLATFCVLVLTLLSSQDVILFDHKIIVSVITAVMLLFELFIFTWTKKYIFKKYHLSGNIFVFILSFGGVFNNAKSPSKLLLYLVFFIVIIVTHLSVYPVKKSTKFHKNHYVLVQIFLLFLSWALYRLTTEGAPIVSFLNPLRMQFVYNQRIISNEIFNSAFLGIVIGILSLGVSIIAERMNPSATT